MSSNSLAGKRVLITGGARGIGAALAKRLHDRGATVAVAGLEPHLLAQVAAELGGPWRQVDVSVREQVDQMMHELVTELGGLDVVVANAGIAKQLPIDGGDPQIMEKTLAVNTLGVYYTLRAAAPHISHPGGYALMTSSLAAAVQVPLLGAYSASKAAVETIGNTLRLEIRPTGARVGVAYFAEIDTDMTSRGFGTQAAKALTGGGTVSGVAPLSSAINALERGIARRSRRIVAPAWVAPLLPIRMIVQRAVELRGFPDLPRALQIARDEHVRFTTDQPGAELDDAGRRAG
ncbi:SDR family NAD(P)-dependent oxidoreductase [Leekyejoonella antrihumi]|uniref:SDR family NAD(P)-dependent oxidoreductase n=1 Tax=Leekyejoonella antrihumi TaxID=1660198 RepID=A0A563E4X8_9MICO|nr:SDR family NAD(P)-dependent oxidoreductase [Leekyejoonella antrihumi]TWP37608.1 SDR family NAD(P)-dependent oxidoreductase [Leekyejoonella antrihumi]